MNLLNRILLDFENYPHVASALEHKHNILINTESSLLIYCPVSDVFIAECENENLEMFCSLLEKHKIVRLETTNQKLWEKLIPRFYYNYACVQAAFVGEKIQDSSLILLKEKDLEYAKSTYEVKDYIVQLYERKRLMGFYKDDKLIGYVAFHIDETVGALFVKPEFRNKGYGTKIMKAALSNYPFKTTYSQILCNNSISINLHKRADCLISDKKLYWVYNEEYCWKD